MMTRVFRILVIVEAVCLAALFRCLWSFSEEQWVPLEEPVSVFQLNLYIHPKSSKKFLKHCEVDGLNLSKYLQLNTHNPSPCIWMASFHRPDITKCKAFAQVAQNVRTIQKIHIVDWSDETNLLRCTDLEQAVGIQHIQYWKRSMVVGRHWNITTRAIDLGQIQSFSDWSNYSIAPVKHIPITVRSDVVQAIHEIAGLNETDLKHTTHALVHLPRPLDVVHFWPCPNDTAALVDNRRRAQLRNHVSQLLLSRFSSCGLHGKAMDAGRESPQYQYLKGMLEYKIVVVAQKDEWEDHYRLFEALVSGAMVMSDVMLTIPDGLYSPDATKTGLVFYHDLQELQDLIVYYLSHEEERLAIAQRGRTIALSRHRSWHWMERVILGQQRSVE